MRRLLAVATVACAALVWVVAASSDTPKDNLAFGKDNLSLHDKVGIVELISRTTGCATCDVEDSYVWRFASDFGESDRAEVAYVSVAYTAIPPSQTLSANPTGLKRVSYLLGFGWPDVRWKIKARSLGHPHVYKCSANVIVNTDYPQAKIRRLMKAKQLRLIRQIAQCR
jgi:hypothetical protein